MLLRPSRAFQSAVLAASLLLCLSYFYILPPDFVQRHMPAFPPLPGGLQTVYDHEPLPVPEEYRPLDIESAFCNDRFNTKYLTDLRNTAFQYCNSTSYSSLTCFHSHTSSDKERDSLCIGKGSVLDVQTGRFILNCDLMEPDGNDTARGIIPFGAIRQYWYDTGPKYLFDNVVQFINLSRVDPASPLPKAKAHSAVSSEVRVPRRFTLLLKREGAGNPWHCLMEIWSMAMTIDVLRMARDPADDGRPFFSVQDDVSNTQVVIIDEQADGPYFDLWKLFSGRDPIRRTQIVDNPEALSFYNDTAAATLAVEHRIIVPLAGASNPIWQNDWTARDCTRSDTLRAFVPRVLRHYGISKTGQQKQKQQQDTQTVRATFIDRKGANTRRLVNQDALLAAVQAQFPDVAIETVDFGSMPFAEQLRVVQRTDVLAGVHGAGMTHIMFLRERVTAVVEIQPSDMGDTFMGFRNLANMRGVDYFRTHADPVHVNAADADAGADTMPKQGAGQKENGREASSDASVAPVEATPLRTRAAWHTENFEIDTESFVKAMGAAIQSVYNKHFHQHEVA